MNSQKLKEALAELQQQRAVIDSAIQNLQKIISTLNGSGSVQKPGPGRPSGKSYLEIAKDVLGDHGKPMRVKEITYHISEEKGQLVQRNSVQASLSRHINTKGADAEIVKVGPGIFALSEWPEEVKQKWTEIVQ